MSLKELSILARRGSGSATRSCYGGFVEWLKGEKNNGSDSYAVQIAKPGHWPEFRIITTIVSTAAKKVPSRTGMAQTTETCPMYKAWLDTISEDIKSKKRNFKEGFHAGWQYGRVQLFEVTRNNAYNPTSNNLLDAYNSRNSSSSSILEKRGLRMLFHD